MDGAGEMIPTLYILINLIIQYSDMFLLSFFCALLIVNQFYGTVYILHPPLYLLDLALDALQFELFCLG